MPTLESVKQQLEKLPPELLLNVELFLKNLHEDRAGQEPENLLEKLSSYAIAEDDLPMIWPKIMITIYMGHPGNECSCFSGYGLSPCTGPEK